MSDPDGSVPPSQAELWGPVDCDRWQEIPCLIGRFATEYDVRAGRAVFFLGTPEEIGVRFADIGLPHCAVLTNDDGEQVPVIIIQSEQAGDKHYVGYRSLEGGNGVAFRQEVQLLDAPDELFRRREV